MPNALRDDNRVPTLLATKSTDGTTPMPVVASPTTHGLIINNGSSGTDRGSAVHDANAVPVALAVSSADGTTAVSLYADADGYLLITNA